MLASLLEARWPYRARRSGSPLVEIRRQIRRRPAAPPCHLADRRWPLVPRGLGAGFDVQVGRTLAAANLVPEARDEGPANVPLVVGTRAGRGTTDRSSGLIVADCRVARGATPTGDVTAAAASVPNRRRMPPRRTPMIDGRIAPRCRREPTRRPASVAPAFGHCTGSAAVKSATSGARTRRRPAVASCRRRPTVAVFQATRRPARQRGPSAADEPIRAALAPRRLYQR